MAPEQYDGADVDPRADLFSVGVMLFFLLTDTFPFEGATLAEQQDAAHRGDFGRARDHRAEVSAEIDALLRRALAPLPRDRFADAKAMGQAIEGLRAHGQAIAGGDDVAAAVEAAQRALPAPGRRVIALSGPGARRSTSDEPAMAERELTRTGAASGVGSFTIRVADGEAGPTLDEARPLRLEIQPRSPILAITRLGSLTERGPDPRARGHGADHRRRARSAADPHESRALLGPRAGDRRARAGLVAAPRPRRSPPRGPGAAARARGRGGERAAAGRTKRTSSRRPRRPPSIAPTSRRPRRQQRRPRSPRAPSRRHPARSRRGPRRRSRRRRPPRPRRTTAPAACASPRPGAGT